jgi:hypothetical protein
MIFMLLIRAWIALLDAVVWVLRRAQTVLNWWELLA